MRSRARAAALATLVFFGLQAHATAVTTPTAIRAGSPLAGKIDPASLLRSLHADYESYIRSVRIVPGWRSEASREALYSGLVRVGGLDPRAREDAPISGRDVRNDIVLFDSAIDPGRSTGWERLILDHEYFHARHLAHGWRTPLVDFGDRGATHDFYEAAAWGYVLQRALDGTYGDLSAADLREVRSLYERHFQAIRAFILKRQPSAWIHYGRFMPDMDGDGAFRQAPGERDEVVRSPSPNAPGGAAGSVSGTP